MKRKVRYALLVVLGLIGGPTLLASEPPSEPLRSKLVFYPFDLTHSCLTIGYERALSHPKWTLAGMLGYRAAENNFIYGTPVSGIYSELQFRYYFSPGGWAKKVGAYAAPFVSYKYTEIKNFGVVNGMTPAPDKQVSVTNFGALLGLRLQTTNRLALDFNLGPGMLTPNQRIGQDFGLDRYRSGWNLHGNLGLGFMF